MSEREGLENDPSFLLGEQLQAVAFARHPYAQGVIGSKEEIKLMTRDGLYAHYRRHYAPNNAYFVVAATRRRGAARSARPARSGRSSRRGADRTAESPGAAAVRREARHRPPRGRRAPDHSDRFQGAARFGSACGRSVGARRRAWRGDRWRRRVRVGTLVALYRALVDTGLATTVDASFSLMKDPYLFIAEAHMRPGVAHAQVEAAILDELDKVATTALGDEEFGRVRRQMLSASAFRQTRSPGARSARRAARDRGRDISRRVVRPPRRGHRRGRPSGGRVDLPREGHASLAGSSRRSR